MQKEKKKYRHGIKIKSKKGRKITKEDLLKRIEALESRLSQSSQNFSEMNKDNSSAEKN